VGDHRHPQWHHRLDGLYTLDLSNMYCLEGNVGMNGQSRSDSPGDGKMKICLIHARRAAGEVLARALSCRLNAEVDVFSYCENALATALDYDVFVVYNNFQKKMTGFQGVKKIRARKPQAFIVGVTSNPNLTRKFISVGADTFLLRAGNEIAELVGIVRQREGVAGSTLERG